MAEATGGRFHLVEDGCDWLVFRATACPLGVELWRPSLRRLLAAAGAGRQAAGSAYVMEGVVGPVEKVSMTAPSAHCGCYPRKVSRTNSTSDKKAIFGDLLDYTRRRRRRPANAADVLGAPEI